LSGEPGWTHSARPFQRGSGQVSSRSPGAQRATIRGAFRSCGDDVLEAFNGCPGHGYLDMRATCSTRRGQKRYYPDATRHALRGRPSIPTSDAGHRAAAKGRRPVHHHRSLHPWSGNASKQLQTGSRLAGIPFYPHATVGAWCRTITRFVPGGPLDWRSARPTYRKGMVIGTRRT